MTIGVMSEIIKSIVIYMALYTGNVTEGVTHAYRNAPPDLPETLVEDKEKLSGKTRRDKQFKSVNRW